MAANSGSKSQPKDCRDPGSKEHVDIPIEELYKLALTSINKLSSESDDLRKQLAKLEAEKQSIVGELETTQVEVMVYKGDFDEERKDRMSAHSKFADLEREMVEHKRNFHASLKIATDELEQHKRSLEDVEKVKVQLENELKEVQDTLEQWRSEALQSREDVQAKTSQVKAYKKQVDQLKLEVDMKTKQLESVTGGLRVLSEKLDGQRKAAKKNKEKVNQKSTTSSVDVGPAEGLERKLVMTEQRCDQLQAESEDWQRRHDELRMKYDGLETEVIHLKLDNQSFRGEIDEQKDKMECEIQLKAAKVSELEKDIRGRLSAIRGLTTNIQNKREENQTLQTANLELEARLDGTDELAPYCLPELPNLGDCRGSGSYGSVYRIQLNGISCIAKRIHDILLGQGREEQVGLEEKRAAYGKFRQECVLLSRMRHPNIVLFMGVHYGQQRDYGRELTLVMECLHMDLEDCLKRYPNLQLSMKISILLDLSQGLLHLHALRIVHRDLTAGNVLVTKGLQAKIADLGVSKILNVHPLTASKQSMLPGTLGYMPPEALAEIPLYSCALDIFSFGVLMLFVAIQEYPQFFENVVTYTAFHRKETQIKKRMKWISRLSENDPIRTVICNCLQDEPQKRPTTAELNDTLVQFSKQHPKSYSDVIELQRQLEQQVTELRHSCQELQRENTQINCKGQAGQYYPPSSHVSSTSVPSVPSQSSYYNSPSQPVAPPRPLPRQHSQGRNFQ